MKLSTKPRPLKTLNNAFNMLKSSEIVEQLPHQRIFCDSACHMDKTKSAKVNYKRQKAPKVDFLHETWTSGEKWKVGRTYGIAWYIYQIIVIFEKEDFWRQPHLPISKKDFFNVNVTNNEWSFEIKLNSFHYFIAESESEGKAAIIVASS